MLAPKGIRMISLTITVEYGALGTGGGCKQQVHRCMVGGDVTTILLVDPDLSFAFWLGRALDGAGYAAFPARSGSDALELLPAINTVPSLIILSSIEVGGGDLLVARCRALNNNVRVMRLLDATEDGGDQTDTDEYQCLKPQSRSEEDSAELLRTVKRALTVLPIAARNER
jgi:hypothetical protein